MTLNFSFFFIQVETIEKSRLLSNISETFLLSSSCKSIYKKIKHARCLSNRETMFSRETRSSLHYLKNDLVLAELSEISKILENFLRSTEKFS